jgi:hypothetical protein
MSDDDFTTLLDLDEGGFHAGGTVRLGSRPLAVASGGITLNPPDLTAVRTGLHELADRIQDAAADPGGLAHDAVASIRHARPDAPVGAAHARGGVGTGRAAIAERAPSVGAPSLDRAALARRAAELTGRSSRQRTLVERLPPGLAAGVALLAAVAMGAALAWLWHPQLGAARRERLLAAARDRWATLRGDKRSKALIAIPIEEGSDAVILSPEAEVSASA